MKDALEFFGVIGIAIVLVVLAVMIACATPDVIDWAKTLFYSDYLQRVAIGTVLVFIVFVVALLVGTVLWLIFDVL